MHRVRVDDPVRLPLGRPDVGQQAAVLLGEFAERQVIRLGGGNAADVEGRVQVVCGHVVNRGQHGDRVTCCSDIGDDAAHVGAEICQGHPCTHVVQSV